MMHAYRAHAAERAALGIPPLPLSAEQTGQLIHLIKAATGSADSAENAELLNLLTHRVPPGVDDAAKVKAAFLAAVAQGKESVPLISRVRATELLGTMLGGYNVEPLIALLDDGDAAVSQAAADALKTTLLIFDFFAAVEEKAKAALDGLLQNKKNNR